MRGTTAALVGLCAYLVTGVDCAPGSQSNAPWHLDRIDQRYQPLDNTYSWSLDGTGTSVFVLDDGIRLDLPAWGSADRSFLADCLDGSYPCSTTPGNTDPSHGTRVAGMVNSAALGVAKGASLFDVRVTMDDNVTTSVITNGIKTVINHPHCQSGSGRRCVINMSLSSATQPYDEDMLDEIEKAYNENIAVVVAAGNQRVDACQRSPAQSTFAITVGGTQDGDYMWDGSNWGTCLDILAPADGVDVLNWEFGLQGDFINDEFRHTSGTSHAAPQVAGALALIFEEDPNLSVQGAYDRLIEMSTKNILGFEDSNRATSPNRLLYVGDDIQEPPVVGPCNPTNPQWVGDGYCDSGAEYNNAACDWDGGDCCEESCDDSDDYECGEDSDFDCQDPAFSD